MRTQNLFFVPRLWQDEKKKHLSLRKKVFEFQKFMVTFIFFYDKGLSWTPTFRKYRRIFVNYRKHVQYFFRFQAYLYDIRGNTFCHRLTGHTDVVSEVAFHPAQPQVLKEPCTLRYTIDTFCMSDIAVSLHYAFGNWMRAKRTFRSELYLIKAVVIFISY